MYDYHVALGLVAILLGLIGFVLYLRSTFHGETKPHPLTWLIYALIDSIVFLAQFVKGGGPGAWPLAASIIMGTIIALVSFRIGEKRITWSDWVCFVGALAAIGLWILTKDPLGAVVLLTVINVLATIPTYRKSFLRPYEESVPVWSLDVARFALSLFALTSFTLTTALFPAGIVVVDSLLIAMILVRRMRLAVDKNMPSATV